MDKLVALFVSRPKVGSPKDDDFADRLSSKHSVILLVVSAVLVSFRQYVGTPITCWAPVHFTGSHRRFANNYCWVRNTYYLPWEEEIPRADEHDKRQMILYYQWIPFILLAQAVFFYLPTVIWHGLNSKAGVDSDNILAASHRLNFTCEASAKKRTLMLLTNQMDRFLESRPQPATGFCDLKHILSSTICRCCGRRMGNYLILLFLFSKLCYIGNVLMQLFLLNRVLSTQFNLYGFDIMSSQVSDHDWTEAKSVVFPRVTMCDFQIRRLGNIHRYTVQCVLPINLYNEKIYMFLWFWMVFVAAASVLSLLLWVIRSIMYSDRLRFVRNHLTEGNRLETDRDRDDSNEFLDSYLRQDGAFLLRLISHNANTITTTEVTCALFDFWREKERNRRDNDDPDAPYGKHLLGDDTLPLETKSTLS